MLGNVVVVAFKIIFVLKCISIIFFYFLKNYFWHQYIKTIQNIQTIFNFSKTKFEFFGNAVQTAFPNGFYVWFKKSSSNIIINRNSNWLI
jgi:hypothetical protein